MRNEIEFELAQEEKRKRKEEERQKKILGDILRNAIKENGLSIERFASYCDISSETLKKYMYGKSFYRADNLIKIAQQLDVPSDYLLGIKSKNTETEELISLVERIEKTTKLSADAVSHLLNMAIQEHKYAEYLEVLSILMQEETILEKLVVYFRFIKNKNIQLHKADDLEEYTLNQEAIYEINCALYDARGPIPFSLSYLDLDNIFLYQMMKEIDTTVKKRLRNYKNKSAHPLTVAEFVALHKSLKNNPKE